MQRRLLSIVAALATVTLAACATGPKIDYAAKYKEERAKYEAVQAARTNYATASVEVVRGGVSKLGSKFDVEAQYSGPIMCLEEYPAMKDPHCDRAGARYSLVSLGGDRGRIVLLANFVYSNSQSWAFYESASLEGGAILKLLDADRQVGNGYFRPANGYLSETVQVRLPPGYLEKNLTSGFDIRFNAKRPRNFDVLHVPSNYIQGFLAAIPK